MKKLTVRMDDDLHDTVQLIASTDGTSVQAVILEAIQSEVERRLSDDSFRKKMAARLSKQAAILERE